MNCVTTLLAFMLVHGKPKVASLRCGMLHFFYTGQLTNGMEKSEHSGAHRLTLVCVPHPDTLPWGLTVPGPCHHHITLVHRCHQLSHQDHIKFSSGELKAATSHGEYIVCAELEGTRLPAPTSISHQLLYALLLLRLQLIRVTLYMR